MMLSEDQNNRREISKSQVSKITFATEERVKDENWLLGFTKVETRITEDRTKESENAPESTDLRQENFEVERKINAEKTSKPSVVDFLLDPALSFDVLYVNPILDESGDLRGYVSCACAGDRNGRFGYSVKYDFDREESIAGSIERAITNMETIKRSSYVLNNKIFYTVAFPVTGVSGGVKISITPECTSSEMAVENILIKRMLMISGIKNCTIIIEGCDPFPGHVLLATYGALMELCENE